MKRGRKLFDHVTRVIQDYISVDANSEDADGETADGEAADGEAADGEAADGEAADGEAADDLRNWIWIHKLAAQNRKLLQSLIIMARVN